MNTYFYNIVNLIEHIIHPAAGRVMVEKKKKRSSSVLPLPKGSPDSLNIRDVYRNQYSVRRNPAP